MKCKTLHKKLIFYLDGELSPAESDAMAAHLAHCAECMSFAEDMKKTLYVLQFEKSPEVSPWFYTRLKARMEKEKKEKPRFGYPVWEKLLQPVLFSLLLLAGIYTGIKIGQPATVNSSSQTFAESQLIPLLNEMEAEPIETFLME
jgi:anti-sigma factor RsiW